MSRRSWPAKRAHQRNRTRSPARGGVSLPSARRSVSPLRAGSSPFHCFGRRPRRSGASIKGVAYKKARRSAESGIAANWRSINERYQLAATRRAGSAAGQRPSGERTTTATAARAAGPQRFRGDRRERERMRERGTHFKDGARAQYGLLDAAAVASLLR